MRRWAAQVTAVKDDGSITFILRGGPRNGEKWAEDARPMYPSGCAFPPVVDELVWVVFQEVAPLADSYWLSGMTQGSDIAINAQREVILKEGTLGVARRTDPVSQTAAFGVWAAAVVAAITALDGGAPVIIPGAAPDGIGTIKTASTVVKAG